MRSLVYLVAMTVDGFIAAADRGNPDFLLFDGPQVPDLLAEFPEMLPRHVRGPLGIDDEENRRFDTIVMGATTYRIGLAEGITSPYPHLRQLVVSRSIASASAPEVEIVADRVVERVRALKAEEGKDIWLAGGGALAAQLVDEIDELILKVSPVVIGSGVPLFEGSLLPRSLSMTDHKVYPNGFSLLRFRWAR